MARMAVSCVRTLSLAVALILSIQILQPEIAGAYPVLTLTKTACSLTMGGTCGTQIATTAGSNVEYIISYSNSGTTGPVTISDTLQAGQAYVPGSCTVNSGSGGTCGASAGYPTIVSFTFPSIPANTSGQVTFSVAINSNATGSIQNMATAGYASVTYGASNTTTVAVSGPGPSPTPSGQFSVSKQVRNNTQGGTYSTGVTVYPTDTIQYAITLNNATTGTSTSVVVNDPLQPGQSFVYNSCAPYACTYDGSSVTFNVGTMAPGTQQTVTFMTNVASGSVTNGQVISNQASASATGYGTVYSNTTSAVVSGGATGGTGTSCVDYSCYYNYCNGYYYAGPCSTSPYTPTCGYYGCSYPTCPTYGCTAYPTSPYCNTYGCPGYPYCVTYTCATPTVVATSTTICGPVTSYTAPSGYQGGSITIAGETFALSSGVLATGTALTVPGNYCLSFTINSLGQVSSMVITPNVAGTSYVCGTVSPFTAGYAPYPGFSPYPGYTAYPTYGPYPGYGPYPTTSGMYGWGGPIMVGSYPFPVASNVYFPTTMNYGNQYCFLLAPAGTVTGSLSTIPTNATPLEQPSGRRVGHLLAD